MGLPKMYYYVISKIQTPQTLCKIHNLNNGEIAWYGICFKPSEKSLEDIEKPLESTKVFLESVSIKDIITNKDCEIMEDQNEFLEPKGWRFC